MPEAEVSQISQRFLENGQEPLLEVGIVSATEIPFTFPEPFRLVQTGKIVQGYYKVCLKNGRMKFEGDFFDNLEFVSVQSNGGRFELPEVKIGIGFHWERTEKQAFEGHLKFLVEGKKLTAVNRVPLKILQPCRNDKPAHFHRSRTDQHLVRILSKIARWTVRLTRK